MVWPNVLLLKSRVFKFKWLGTNLVQVWMRACECLRGETQRTVQGTSNICFPHSPSRWEQMSQQRESLYLLLLTQTSLQKANPKKTIIEDISCQNTQIKSRVFAFLCSDKGHWFHVLAGKWHHAAPCSVLLRFSGMGRRKCNKILKGWDNGQGGPVHQFCLI